MGYKLHLGGPHRPLADVVPRPLGSVRRTTTIDTVRPEGTEGLLLSDGRARDLLTRSDGSTQVLGEQRFTARMTPEHLVEELSASPGDQRLGELLGATVGPGFRARVTALVPDHAEAGTLLHLLLDDWPGATLVSGYARQRAWTDGEAEPTLIAEDHMPFMADICTGWQEGATLMSSVRAERVVPTPLGPVEPAEEPDPLARHEVTALAAHSTRRARRLDVALLDDERCSFDVHFRDTHRDREGVTTVLHEYTVAGTADRADHTVLTVHAEVRVLPWQECPGAIHSANRIVGMSLDDLRARVRGELVGTTTCTHLNDTLRGIQDVAVLSGRARECHVVTDEPGTVELVREGWLRRERAELLTFLGTLDAEAWAAPTECPAWDAKQVALHVLGDDLSLLARQRDAEAQGLILYAEGHPGLDFRQLLDGFNEQWVTAASFLGPTLLLELLRLTGEWTATLYETVDLLSLGEPVGFFGVHDASPYWQIANREYIERWVHHQQIRRAVGAPDADPAFLATAVGVFARATATRLGDLGFAAGTVVALELADLATWSLRWSARDGDRWELGVGPHPDTAATLTFAVGPAARLFTRAPLDPAQGEAVTISGDPEIGQPALAAMATYFT